MSSDELTQLNQRSREWKENKGKAEETSAFSQRNSPAPALAPNQTVSDPDTVPLNGDGGQPKVIVPGTITALPSRVEGGVQFAFAFLSDPL
jgi:hypothetical protein